MCIELHIHALASLHASTLGNAHVHGCSTMHKYHIAGNFHELLILLFSWSIQPLHTFISKILMTVWPHTCQALIDNGGHGHHVHVTSKLANWKIDPNNWQVQANKKSYIGSLSIVTVNKLMVPSSLNSRAIYHDCCKHQVMRSAIVNAGQKQTAGLKVCRQS